MLSLGNYKITATLEGFQTEARSGVVLTVGREAVVDLQLTVGSISQTPAGHRRSSMWAMYSSRK